MGFKDIVIDCLRSHAADVTVDFVVLINAIFVGMEVDFPDMVKGLGDMVRLLICVVYIVEWVVRLAMEGKTILLHKHLLKAELIIVVVAIYGALAAPDNPLLWRCSVVRSVRLLRVTGRARQSVVLGDLWLSIAAMGRGMRALGWLMLIGGAISFFFGGSVRGFIYGSGENDDLNTALCGDDDFRHHLNCLEVDQYFGSVSNTAVTMMQVATLDRWAAHVVRPLSKMRIEAAIFLTCFVLVATYGFLNIAVGVIVWATVELAQLHDSHRDRVQILQDREHIRNLRNYLESCLQLEGREFLDEREIKEAMHVFAVKKVYDELDLPVTDMKQLWAHLDPLSEGEISLDAFEYGCQTLLEPAKRYDMAALSARLNGRAEFTKVLLERCDTTLQNMDSLCAKLRYGFATMRTHVLSDHVNEVFAEVGLRRAGKMEIPHVESDEL